MLKKRLLLFFFLFTSFYSFAQPIKRKLIQVSGVVHSIDSFQVVQYVNIIDPGARRVIISDRVGYFSFASYENDTLYFSAIGYKPQRIIIPKNVVLDKLTLNLRLRRDTINLPIVSIYPWNTLEEFKKAFIETEIPDDGLAIAQKNLDPETLKKVAKTLPRDGGENAKITFMDQANRRYYAGQLQPNPLLDIVAWGKFLKLIKEGKVSFKDDE